MNARFIRAYADDGAGTDLLRSGARINQATETGTLTDERDDCHALTAGRILETSTRELQDNDSEEVVEPVRDIELC